MRGVVKRVDHGDDVVFYNEYRDDAETLIQCKAEFAKLVDAGKAEGSFDDDRWRFYSGTKWYGLDFSIDEIGYCLHFADVCHRTASEIKQALKCYTMVVYGQYISFSIAGKRRLVILRLLEQYGEDDFRIKRDDRVIIRQFLLFLSLSESEVDGILNTIRMVQTDNKKKQRKLKPIITYLVLWDAVDNLYHGDLSDDEFKKWFPIFFWTHVTFIIPLRATEMLVTPFECLSVNENGIFITVRRTLLKKGKKKVYNDVDKDYKLFTYRIPLDNWAIKIIERYIAMTRNHERRFLFDYSGTEVYDMLTLPTFNKLIASFMKDHIAGNECYNYARYATEIEEFEPVTAGDSRHIAMSNLVFNGIPIDIARQLADHENIETSAGYYSNISEIVEASSVMNLQKSLRAQSAKIRDYMAERTAITVGKPICLSPIRLKDPKSLEDCKKEGHIENCIGCRYYIPTEKEVDEYGKEKKAILDKEYKTMLGIMNDLRKRRNIKNGQSVEELFLKVVKDGYDYRNVSDLKAKEKAQKWVEQ